jgi:hypothetical protein
MPAVLAFNTQEVRLWNDLQPQTSKVVGLPETYVAPPRLPVGLNSLDMQMGTNLRVNAYNDTVDQQKFTTHVETWGDTTLFSAGTNTLVLKPASIDILSGEFKAVTTKTSDRITFERSFVTTPKVVVFLKSFDTGGGGSTRVKAYTSDVDRTGFTIHVETWADTNLYAAVAGWVAYPEDRSNIYSGTVNTMDVRPWQNPQTQTSQEINFHGYAFQKKPNVFVALNFIDISTQANLRITAYVDNVKTDGLTWHVDSWADTKLWAAGISYIALDE